LHSSTSSSNQVSHTKKKKQWLKHFHIWSKLWYKSNYSKNSSRINMKKPYWEYNKLLKADNKEKMFKSSCRKKTPYIEGSSFISNGWFHNVSEKTGKNIFSRSGKICQPRTLHLVKIFFKTDVKKVKIYQINESKNSIPAVQIYKKC
jgi:hypothetical protein